MTTSAMYNKAVIRKAIESTPPAQLAALTDFFMKLSRPAIEPTEEISDEEYAECLSIINNADKEEWYGIEDIG